MNDETSYHHAIADHSWCMDRNIIARITFYSGRWYCEYCHAFTAGWMPFRQG